MSQTLHVNSRKKIYLTLNQLVELFKQRRHEGKALEITIAEAAGRLGFAYHYFKYGVLPTILALTPCIKRTDDKLVWVCEG